MGKNETLWQGRGIIFWYLHKVEDQGKKRGENESAPVLPERSTDTYFDVLTTCLTTPNLLAGCRGKWAKGGTTERSWNECGARWNERRGGEKRRTRERI